MIEQVSFVGTTPAQLIEAIVRGVIEEFKKLTYTQQAESNEQIDEYLTIEEACKFLKCSDTKLWRLRKDKTLKGYENGRSVLLKKSELEEYLNKSRG